MSQEMSSPSYNSPSQTSLSPQKSNTIFGLDYMTIGCIVLGLVCIGILVWFLFFRNSSSSGRKKSDSTDPSDSADCPTVDCSTCGNSNCPANDCTKCTGSTCPKCRNSKLTGIVESVNDNGTMSCIDYCQRNPNAVVAGESAYTNAAYQYTDEFGYENPLMTHPEYAAKGKTVTCGCYNAAPYFVEKQGNNGSVSCDDYCKNGNNVAGWGAQYKNGALNSYDIKSNKMVDHTKAQGDPQVCYCIPN